MDNNTTTTSQRSDEWKTFLFIVIFLFPILSVIIVGGYGFFIWMMQIFFWGPPGHG
ncbi:trimethylamine N-oxide reductase system protein TorE [Thaumasiovibrio subtropicus]|uniref:trimethylamine N-oxide reductase system protein TorE n=1 Tax=Thaumasiovibrio subtropicus TaxID=1891207 RepID=UPI000B350089|nr:trimethylamine N-oxide reductase system protein TorE [Thaumasiovibrio subtropicus]